MSAGLIKPAPQPDLPKSKRGRSKALIAGNIYLQGRRTSVRLEAEMWSALHDIAGIESRSIHDLCSRVDDSKPLGETFTGALRSFLVRYYRDAAQGKPGGTAPPKDTAQAPDPKNGVSR